MVDPASHPLFRELPEGAHPGLAPLAGLIGTWSGSGVGGYPDLDEDFTYEQTLSFTPLPGKPVLGYQSRTWRPSSSAEDPGGVQPGAPMATEVGFWRLSGDTTVEVMLAHPFGIVEIYVGDLAPTATGFKIELNDNIGRGGPGLRHRHGGGGASADAAPVRQAQPRRRLTPARNWLQTVEPPGTSFAASGAGKGHLDTVAPGGSGVCLVFTAPMLVPHTAGDPRDGVSGQSPHESNNHTKPGPPPLSRRSTVSSRSSSGKRVSG
jgi:hypothetical protein